MAGLYLLSGWRTRKTIESRSTELNDRRITALTGRLAKAAGIPEIRAKIYDVAPINGLATPNGRIYITRGMFDCFRRNEITAAEVASVIAHELGHVALGHTRRRLLDFAGQNAIRFGLGFVLGRFLPWIGPWLANGLVTLLAQRVSRTDEYAADAYASALLSKSGIGTKPQKDLFNKLERLTGQPGGTPAWLMSHPPTEARIKAIEKLEERWYRQNVPTRSRVGSIVKSFHSRER